MTNEQVSAFLLGLLASLIASVVIGGIAWRLAIARERWRWTRDQWIRSYFALITASKAFFDEVNRIYQQLKTGSELSSLAVIDTLLPLMPSIQEAEGMVHMVAPKRVVEAAKGLRDRHSEFATWLTDSLSSGGPTAAEYKEHFDPLGEASGQFIDAARESLTNR